MMTLAESLDIITESFSLELELLNRDYNYARGISLVEGVSIDDVMDIFEEKVKKQTPQPTAPEPAEEKVTGKGKNFFNRVLDSIINFFHKLNERIQSHFKSTEDVELSEYLASQTGSVQLEYDLDKVENFVNQQFLKGRKIVQAISSATGISDAKVAAFCDECTQTAIDFTGPTIEFFAIDRVRDKIANTSFRKMDKLISNFRNVETWDEKSSRVEAEHQADRAVRQRQKQAKKDAHHAKREEQKNKVVNALAGLSRWAGDKKNKTYQSLTSAMNKAGRGMHRNKNKEA